MSSVRELLDSCAHYSPSVPVISTDPSLIRPEIGIWIMAMRSEITQGNSHRNRDPERWGVVRETGEREREELRIRALSAGAGHSHFIYSQYFLGIRIHRE